MISKFPKKIVSVNIKGGLGNQLFQIAAAYAYAKKENGVLQIIHKLNSGDRPVYWDTLLEKIKPYLVTYIPATLEHWSEKLPTMYKDIGPLTLSGKYLNGYLQSSKYYYNLELKQEIRELFTPNQNLINNILNKYEYLIANKDRVVIIHARRTDYMIHASFFGPLTSDYYKEAINKMSIRINNPIYLLCGDDISYWTEIRKDISIVFDNEHFILENETDINTFVLLQQFKNVIMSNSTFIWWTTWLSNAEKVYVPKKWFGSSGPYPYDDIYEDNWERI